MKRRSFIILTSLGAASTTMLGACGHPEDKLISALVPDEEYVPGIDYFTPTTCMMCTAGCGIVVRTREHKANKLEGLPLIPDLALVRGRSRGLRRRMYGLLSLGWQGTQLQWARLEKAVEVMAVIIIPVAVSVHTIVSWDFAMAIQPMWHSTMFGPYFVAGAIFSGIAALIIAMAVIRRVFHLEEYLRPVHFNNLGLLLLTMSMVWFYFTFAEYLTTWYGNEPAEKAVFQSKVSGPFSPLFWAMIVCCFVIPIPILAFKRLRTVAGTVIASVCIVGGMWLERFLIIVPTLAQPRLTFNWGSYSPTWVEITIMAGTFGYFVLLYTVFTKLFPIVAVWEYKEGFSTQVTASLPLPARRAAAARGRGD